MSSNQSAKTEAAPQVLLSPAGELPATEEPSESEPPESEEPSEG